MTVGKNLKQIRKDKGISQVSLAKMANVSQQLISQLESGTNVTTNRLPQIAHVLGVEVWEIDPKFKPGASSPHLDPELSIEEARQRLSAAAADASKLGVPSIVIAEWLVDALGAAHFDIARQEAEEGLSKIQSARSAAR